MNRTLAPTQFPQSVTVRPVATPTTPSRMTRAAAPAPVAVPRMSMAEMGAAARDIGGAMVVGVATLGAVSVADALVERTGLTEGQRAAVQGAALVGAGSVAVLTGARTFGHGLIAAGVVSAGARFVRAKQWDRIAGRWLAEKLGTARPEERTGGALWDEDPEIRVEAIAN